jgi:hypothetical protein
MEDFEDLDLKNLQNDLELLYKDWESPDKYSLFLALIQHLTCCRVLRDFSHNWGEFLALAFLLRDSFMLMAWSKSLVI